MVNITLLPPDADPPLLILYGTKAKRRVLHLSSFRQGRWLPICNAHYTAHHDLQPRRFREPEGQELDYPICRRCEAWKDR